MDGKSAVGSVTIVSAIVILLVQLLQLFGIAVSIADQETLTNAVNALVVIGTSIATVVGGISVIIGRVRAKKEITSILPTKENSN